MRIIVMSDSHGRQNKIYDVISREFGADAIIFLGDGLRDFNGLNLPERMASYSVRGNCDLAAIEPHSTVLELGGKRIYATHGHNQMVKYGLDTLIDVAENCSADIALFGHTHIPITQYRRGIYLINPGSVGGIHTHRCTYCKIDIRPNGVLASICEI